MFKKGQITLFIVIGIVIVAAISAVYFLDREIFRSKEAVIQAESVAVSQEAKVIMDVVKLCLKEAAGKAILEAAAWGGKPLQEDAFEEEGTKTNYWYLDGVIKLPELEEVEKNLGLLSVATLTQCADFKSFKNLKSLGKPKMNVKVLDESARFSLQWPIEVSSGESTERLEQYNEVVDARLGLLYQIAKKTTEEKAMDKGELCLTCLAEMTRDEGVYPLVDVYDNNILITFIDSANTVNGQRMEYRFALKERLAA